MVLQKGELYLNAMLKLMGFRVISDQVIFFNQFFGKVKVYFDYA